MSLETIHILTLNRKVNNKLDQKSLYFVEHYNKYYHRGKFCSAKYLYGLNLIFILDSFVISFLSLSFYFNIIFKNFKDNSCHSDFPVVLTNFALKIYEDGLR